QAGLRTRERFHMNETPRPGPGRPRPNQPRLAAPRRARPRPARPRRALPRLPPLTMPSSAEAFGRATIPTLLGRAARSTVAAGVLAVRDGASAVASYRFYPKPRLGLLRFGRRRFQFAGGWGGSASA